MKTKHKKLVLIGLVAGLALVAGCQDLTGDSGHDAEGAKEISDSTDVSGDIDGIGESYYFEVGITEENQKGLVEAQPPFVMEQSLERQNLIDRYKYLNDRNNVHHVYMLSHDGKVVNYEVAQGKVSSVNSKLTNDRQIVKAANCGFDGGSGAGGSKGPCFKTVESPQMDGSYGENGNAIFFFTTDGHYVEWNGIYVVSEEPKQITSEITLVDTVDEENATGE